MPSVSEKQARTMRAAKHNPEFAKKMGIPQSVASDFVAADKAKGHHMRKGGMKKLGAMRPKLPAALAAEPAPNAPAGPVTAGTPGVPGMKHGGKTHKLAEGGETVKSEQGPVKHWALKGEAKDAKGDKVSMKHGGKLHSRGHGAERKGYSKGGSVRGDGIAERGHTRGRFV